MFCIYHVLQALRILTLEPFPTSQVVDTKVFLHPSGQETPKTPVFDLHICGFKDVTDLVTDSYVFIR
jgi:hypothetical protein